MKWDEGGAYRVALHAVSGGLTGGLSGALGAGVVADRAKVLDILQVQARDALVAQGADPELAKAISQGVVEAAALGIGAAVGGTAGGGAALATDTNNRQLHPTEISWIASNAKSFVKTLSEKLGRPVSELQATQWLTMAGEADVDLSYLTLASRQIGSAASEESMAFFAAKQFIVQYGKGSFIDDSGKQQTLFVAKHGDFQNGAAFSEYRNDKNYRDYYWTVMGDNLRPDNPTAEELAVYNARESQRLSNAAKGLAVNSIPALIGLLAGRVAALRDRPVDLTTIKKDASVGVKEVSPPTDLKSTGTKGGVLAEGELAASKVKWVDENAGMSQTARDYNDAATGARSNPVTHSGQAPALERTMPDGSTRPVKFDGVDGDVMVDRKISVVTTEKAKDQALRQSEVLRQNGLVGRWEVPTDAQAARATKMFNDLGITNIQVKVVKP